MATNTAQIFPIAANVGTGIISTANTGRDGSGTIVDILTAGTNGTRVNRVTVTAQGSVTQDIVRLFIYNGSAYVLFEEIPVYGTTASGIALAWSAVSRKISVANPLFLPAAQKLSAAPNAAQTYSVVAEGANY